MPIEVEDDEFEVMTLSDGTKCLDTKISNTLASWWGWVQISTLRVGHAFQMFLLKIIRAQDSFPSNNNFGASNSYATNNGNTFYVDSSNMQGEGTEDLVGFVEEVLRGAFVRPNMYHRTRRSSNA